jgi:hypothetical protein
VKKFVNFKLFNYEKEKIYRSPNQLGYQGI